MHHLTHGGGWYGDTRARATPSYKVFVGTSSAENNLNAQHVLSRPLASLTDEVRELITRYGRQQRLNEQQVRSPFNSLCEGIARCLSGGRHMDESPRTQSEKALLDYMSWKAQQGPDAHTHG